MPFLSQKLKSTIKVVKYLASNNVENADQISDATELSVSYIEQLIKPLRDTGIVSGVRGPGGGYSLSKRESDITLFDLADAADDEKSFLPLLKAVSLDRVSI